ncbi:hypothetical protein HHK36_032652 [Tetracentron sinense]|uniref:SUI1 domain-containing protein n=1 Tax=Tetracentron sinense TaxID=13715 RepID=A0A834Y563_TETSI|nr:hypothetical protein HHK36_032652 [Tetracentron sinense]
MPMAYDPSLLVVLQPEPTRKGNPMGSLIEQRKSLFVSSLNFQQSRFMSELDSQIPTAFDPFAEANAEDSAAGTKEYVHVRTQQRNGRKSLTTVQGLKKEFSYNKILKDLKKEFCCNGTVVQDPELGQVIQLQGDQRKNVSTFLVQVVFLPHFDYSPICWRGMLEKLKYPLCRDLMSSPAYCHDAIDQRGFQRVLHQVFRVDETQPVAAQASCAAIPVGMAGIVKKELIKIHGF